MRTFSLTTAEAEIALKLGAGETLANIAASRRTSIHTVRDQAKAIMSKCNARRQAELVLIIGKLCSLGEYERARHDGPLIAMPSEIQ